MCMHVCVCMQVERETSDNLMLSVWILVLGVLYTYLAEGVGNSLQQGAFRALKRGYILWSSGRLDCIEINSHHPIYCHVRCKATPSMKAGVYHVYVLLKHEGNLASISRATCECAAG